MNFLKDIFLGAIKGILSLGIALIMLLIFFSIIGALFSPDTEEEVVVSDNRLIKPQKTIKLKEYILM